MTYLLDTDTCIAVLRKNPAAVGRMQKTSPEDCAISAVTVFELFSGVEKADDPGRERGKVELFISTIAEIPLDRTAAQAAARIRADLERRGAPIGAYDLLIAGHALANGLTLVTNNVREFQRVQGLKVESWF